MKKTLAMILGATLVATAANARIGETVAACTARYGEPGKSQLDEKQTGVVLYEKNDLIIRLHFVNGKSDLIRYSPGQVAKIDLETALYLLEVNGREKKWTQLTEIEETIYMDEDERRQKPRIRKIDPVHWETKDQLISASWSASQGSLEIRTNTMQLRIREGL